MAHLFRLFIGVNLYADGTALVGLIFWYGVLQAWASRDPIPMYFFLVLSLICTGLVIFWYAF